MLDPVIRKHIDEQDELEMKLRDDIDKLIQMIDIDQVIDDPDSVIMEMVESLNDIIVEKYTDDAVKAGLDIGLKLETMKRKVKVPQGEGDVNAESESNLLEDRQDGN